MVNYHMKNKEQMEWSDKQKAKAFGSYGKQHMKVFAKTA